MRAEALGPGGIRLMVVRGRAVGVTLLAPGAGEGIALWALALSSGLRLGAVQGSALPYPTRSELSKRAAGAYSSPKLFSPDYSLRRRFMQAGMV